MQLFFFFFNHAEVKTSQSNLDSFVKVLSQIHIFTCPRTFLADILGLSL